MSRASKWSVALVALVLSTLVGCSNDTPNTILYDKDGCQYLAAWSQFDTIKATRMVDHAGKQICREVAK